MLDLLPFQRRFLKAALAPAIRTAALSLPRGNGKSALAGYLVTRILTPGDPLFREGTESVLVAASIEQARVVFRFARADLEGDPKYRFLDSHTRIGITHRPTNTRLRVIASNGRTAMGLVNCPWAVCDEPGAWQTVGGELVWDAIETAQGKPGSPLRALLIGTLAPATAGWWHDMVKAGSRGATHVTSIVGNAARWDQWNELRRCNPLMARFPESRKVLLEERDAARGDTRLRARFMSYRLNLPSRDESETLLTVEDWQRACARPEGLPAGSPIVGVDLGGGRAWSAAVALWESGRCEALAVAPGIPDLAEQEARDRVPRGTYQRLADSGSLRIAAGLRVQPPSQLVDAIRERWGKPALLLCDRFRESELRDAAPNWPLKPRVTRWSEASEDIRALRRIALDGPLSVGAASKALLTASLAVATVRNDDQGSCRLEKRGSNNQARDDVAAALLLAAGSFERSKGHWTPRSMRYAIV